MIRLGLRLTLRGGREAAARLVITSLAVALGVGMILAVLASMSAVNAQQGRAAWTSTMGVAPARMSSAPEVGSSSATRSAAEGLWWLGTTDIFNNQAINRVDVAPAGPNPPLPPGVRRLPGPGEFSVSPALRRLIHSNPADELGARFPGTEIGTIGPAGLPSPDSLVAVVGHTPSQLARVPGVTLVSRFGASGSTGGGAFAGPDRGVTEVLLAVSALALLLPVLVFVGMATRISAARREQRFAAMRLVGATPRQVASIASVEASAGAFFGVELGLFLYSALRPALSHVALTGMRPFPADLVLSSTDLFLVIVGVPLGAALAARLALRRTKLSPLGVTRRVARPEPRLVRLFPLAGGIGLLAWLAAQSSSTHPQKSVGVFALGFALTMLGLVASGPWLVLEGARVITRRTERAASLIAGRRLADDPRSAFRAISGLVLSLFVGTVLIGAFGTVKAQFTSPIGGSGAHNTVVDQFVNNLVNPTSSVPLPAGSATAAGTLMALPGVLGVSVIRSAPMDPSRVIVNDRGPIGVVLSAELARTPALGRASPGAPVVTLNPNFLNNGGVLASNDEAAQAATVWPAAPVSPAELATLPVESIVVATDGTRAAVDRARTLLDREFIGLGTPLTMGEITPATAALLDEGQQFVDVIIAASLLIAGCSLAVGVVGAISERKRPFSLLRLAGAPLRVVRHVVAIEVAVPLLGGAVLSFAAGLAAADFLAHAVFASTLRLPGLPFYLVASGGVVVSLAISALSLPVLGRVTSPSAASSE